MAATSSGALKAYVEGLGLGISSYRDTAPDGAALPYVVIHEAIALVPGTGDSPWDNAGKPPFKETVQVSVWQRRKKTTTDNSLGESLTLVPTLTKALHGAKLPTSGNAAPPTHWWGVRVTQAAPRMVDDSLNLVHVPISLVVDRDL